MEIAGSVNQMEDNFLFVFSDEVFCSKKFFL